MSSLQARGRDSKRIYSSISGIRFKSPMALPACHRWRHHPTATSRSMEILKMEPHPPHHRPLHQRRRNFCFYRNINPGGIYGFLRDSAPSLLCSRHSDNQRIVPRFVDEQANEVSRHPLSHRYTGWTAVQACRTGICTIRIHLPSTSNSPSRVPQSDVSSLFLPLGVEPYCQSWCWSCRQ